MSEGVQSDSFPVAWDDPADAELPWAINQMHSPDVVTPLGFDLGSPLKLQGFALAMEELGLPVADSDFRHINYYAYSTRRPRPGTPAISNLSHPQLLEWLHRAPDRWERYVLPRVFESISYYAETDFDSMAEEDLLAEFLRMKGKRVEEGRLHHLATQPWQIMMNLLLDTYLELTGGQEIDAIRLTQGYGNKSVEAGAALWAVSRLADSIPEVRDCLSEVTSDSALETLETLKAEEKAKSFIEALYSFLDAYGWRNDLTNFDTPTWVEDPTIPLVQIRHYLAMDEGYDPAQELERLANQRDEHVQKTKAALTPADWSRIEDILEVVTPYVSVLEDHNFYIDQRLSTLPRRAYLAIGRRLVSDGVLRQPADVFFLHFDEVTAALSGDSADRGALVSRRMEEMAFWAKRRPPRTLGSAATGSFNPQVARFMGAHSLVSDEPNLLRGNAGSAGTATGAARVILSLREADTLQKGNVLVARTTMPPWTPLFAVASAIIVETGGILSHAAITAREYAIPAVVGVVDATQIIRDGQLLEVDGDSGRIRILS